MSRKETQQPLAPVTGDADNSNSANSANTAKSTNHTKVANHTGDKSGHAKGGLLRNHTFLTLFGIGSLQSAARWLELLAFSVFVFDQSGSAFLVTLVTLVKFAPLAIFGPLFGALPTRFAPRNLYLLGIIFMLVVNGVGLALAMYTTLSVGTVLLISFIGGLFWVLDFPVRRTMIGDAVQHTRLGQAMALDTIANNGTRMLGPVVGGTLLQFVGLSGAFAIAIVFYLVCLMLTLLLRSGRVKTSSDEGSGEQGLVNLVASGGRLVRRQPLLLAILLVTVIYNLFGFPILSLAAVIGRDALQLTQGQVGLLVSMEGTGAFLGSLILLATARINHYRRLYTAGLLLTFLASMAYAFLNYAIPIAVLLVFVGIGSASFAAMQTTLLILNSEAKFRSRLFGLLSLSIGTGLIGFAQIGLLAYLFGARLAIFISATLGLLSLLALCWRWPQIMADQPPLINQ